MAFIFDRHLYDCERYSVVNRHHIAKKLNMVFGNLLNFIVDDSFIITNIDR